MSRELTNRMLSGISDQKLKIVQKNRKNALKALKKNTRQKNLEKFNYEAELKPLSHGEKKKQKIYNEKLEKHQKKCLEYLKNEKYRFKPSEKMIKKQNSQEEEETSIFSAEDFKNWENDFFKASQTQKKSSEKQKFF